MLFFSISFSAMFVSDAMVISISLQVEFTESLTMMSGLFAVIVLSVLTGMSHMMVMFCLYEEPQGVIFLHGIWRHIKEFGIEGQISRISSPVKLEKRC